VVSVQCGVLLGLDLVVGPPERSWKVVEVLLLHQMELSSWLVISLGSGVPGTILGACWSTFCVVFVCSGVVWLDPW
jgi:hypothetical protein